MSYPNNIKRFFKNLSWLISLQGLGYLFSFISIPVIISKFGYEKSGIIFTIQAIIFALAGLTNYSLNFYIPTQSKAISLDKKKFNQLWFLALTIRSWFTLILIFISTIIVYYYFTGYNQIWLYGLVLFLPKIINPNLFYNALEQNHKILLINVLSKFLFILTLLIIPFYYLVNFALGITEFFVVLFFLLYEKWKFGFLSFKKVTSFLTKTFSLFLVHLFSLIKPASVLPLISFLFGNAMVTTYTFADKIINVVRGISGASFISFYPILNKENLHQSTIKLKNLSKIFLISLFFLFGIYILAPYLIYLLNNFSFNKDATKLLRILSFSIPISFLIIPFFSLFLDLKKWQEIVLLAFIQLASFFIGLEFFHQNIFQIAIMIVVSELIMLIGYFLVAVKIK